MRKFSSLKASAAPMVLGLAMVSAPVYAQDQDVQEADAATGNVIVVTGSRISNPNLEQSSPVAVVTSDDIELRQANVVEEFIREIPGVVPSVGAQVNNGNGGNTFINLRGIGEVRNITMLNSTRVVPAGLAGLTNLDVIPVALLDRVDVLTGGAGSTYGADAISGVVNFITKKDFSGVDLSVTQGLTEEGDGNLFRADLTVGANFDDGRGNAVLSVGYTDRDAVFQGDRDFGAFNISSFSGNAGGSSTAVPTVITVPGTTSGTLQVSPDGNSLQPFYSPYNFNPSNIFQTPLEQFRIYGSARYEITESVEVFSEALFSQSTTSTIIAPSGTFRNVLTTPLSSPYMNDGIRNQICGFDTDADTAGVQRLFSQAECDAGALAVDPNDPNYQTVDLDYGRRFVELGNRINEYSTRLFQIKAGLRGGITDNISYELFGAYGESRNDSRQSGNGTFTRLQQSVLSTNTTTCLDGSNGCVPINLFGPLGSITPDVASFLDVGNSGSTFTSLAQVQGYISGDLGVTSPFADVPIDFSVGGEYRKYTAGTRSDLLTQTPGEVLGNGAANPDSFGQYDVYEAFAELSVPLVTDAPFAEELTLQLGGRVSDYSSTGTEYTYKAGGSWTPVSGFQIRGNYQRVTRAPNIGELFAPQTTGLDNFDVDPCVGAAPVGNATLAAVCLAQGAPAASIGNIIVDPAGQVNVTFGGNPNVGSEDADTYTIGFIARPDFIPGLSLTLDYYNIKVTGAITTPTGDDVFAACFGDNFRTAVSVTAASANDPACTSIRRNPATGNLFGSVATTQGLPLVLSNLGTIKTDGIDLALNYQSDLGFAGLNLAFNGNWTNSSKFQATPSSIDRECVGFYSTNCASIQPEFSFTQRTTLMFDDVDVSLLWRYVDGVEVEPLVAGTFLPEFETIEAEHYFDLTVRAQAMTNLQFTIAALNIFDNQPKLVGSNIGATAYNSGNIYPSTYDPLGRRFSVTAKLTF